MCESVQAVLEALMWVQVMFEDLVNDPDGVRKAIREVEEVIESLKHGIAVDFKIKSKVPSLKRSTSPRKHRFRTGNEHPYNQTFFIQLFQRIPERLIILKCYRHVVTSQTDFCNLRSVAWFYPLATVRATL